MQPNRYEKRSDDVEGRLDFILKPKPSIGIEAKGLNMPPPQDLGHPQITKGLRQSKERRASYFIWTNGDCWQFFSLALKNAPLYQVTLSSARGDIFDKLCIIEKKPFTDNPEIFDEAIRNNWKTRAFPDAWEMVLDKHTNDLYQLISKGLPTELEIRNEEVLEFLKKLKPFDADLEPQRGRTKQVGISHSFPDDWEQLIDSDETEYERDRKRFHSDPNRKLGQYLLSEAYREWSRNNTYKHCGLLKERAKRSGPVITLFTKWRFIEKVEGTGKYKRVEDSVKYLKKLFE